MEVTYTHNQNDVDSTHTPDDCGSTQQQLGKQSSESTACIKKKCKDVEDPVSFHIPTKNRFKVLCNKHEETDNNSLTILLQGTYKPTARVT